MCGGVVNRICDTPTIVHYDTASRWGFWHVEDFYTDIEKILLSLRTIQLLNRRQMKISFYISALLLALTVVGARAQDFSGQDSDDATIIEHIEENGNVAVNMPSELLKRLQPVNDETEKLEEQPKASATTVPASGKMGGYRIQVFSDNNAQTAKAEARARAKNVSAKFPEYATYVVFSSPYWRLRVGNFRTQEEANNAAHLLKEAFPSYSREIRVVRDRITVGK